MAAARNQSPAAAFKAVSAKFCGESRFCDAVLLSNCGRVVNTLAADARFAANRLHTHRASIAGTLMVA